MDQKRRAKRRRALRYVIAAGVVWLGVEAILLVMRWLVYQAWAIGYSL